MAKLIDELKGDFVEIETILNRVKDTSIANMQAHRLLVAAQGFCSRTCARRMLSSTTC